MELFEVHGDNFLSAARALHWFCADYHSGQWSPLYEVMSKLGYAPGMGETSPDVGDTDDPEAFDFYQELERIHESDGSNVAIEKAKELLEDIQATLRRSAP